MLVGQLEFAKNVVNWGWVKEERFAEHARHLGSTDVHATH
jgi:hypothetical protein